MTSVIYIITNIVNDKQYVGQAVVKDKRWRDHRIMLNAGKHKNRHLQASYNKYGKEAFIYTVLEKVDVEFLDFREQYWMNILNTVTPNGYNLNPAAGSALGFKHSEETKKRWSEQRKGKKRSAEFAASVAARMTGKIVSSETKERQRLAQLGSTKSDETKAKHAARMAGNSHNKGKKRKVPMSEETRELISQANKLAHKRRKEKRQEELDKAWNLALSVGNSSWPD